MGSSYYQALADAVVVFHALFVLFAVAGALLVLWRPRLAWLHLPAVAWAALVEINGWICPLTPLEQDLRNAAGAGAYEGGFVDHYLMPVLYPAGLTPGTQVVLGVAVIVINALSYAWVLRKRRRAGATNAHPSR